MIMYGKKDLSKLVKKTIVDKNGISRIVWVKRDDKKTKKPKKAKKEKEDKATSSNERNYKIIATEDLIKEAKELGVSWKENSDSRINRMRVIMKLKEYYATSNEKILSKPKIDTPKKPDYLTSKEYKKYGGSYTQEKIEKAREMGILGEDEETQKFLDKMLTHIQSVEDNNKYRISDILKKFPDSMFTSFLKSISSPINSVDIQSFLPNNNNSLDALKSFYVDEKQYQAAHNLMFSPSSSLNFKVRTSRLAIQTVTGVNQFDRTLKALDFLGKKESHDSLKKVLDKYGNTYTYYMIECLLGNHYDFTSAYLTKDSFKSPSKDLTAQISKVKEVLSDPSHLNNFVKTYGIDKKDAIGMFENTLNSLLSLREEFKAFEKQLPSKLGVITIDKAPGGKLKISDSSNPGDPKFLEVIQEFSEVLYTLNNEASFYQMGSRTNNIVSQKTVMAKHMFDSYQLPFDESLHLHDISKELIEKFKDDDPKLVKELAKHLEANGYSDEATKFASGMNTTKSIRELQCSIKSVSPEIYKELEAKILEDFDDNSHHFKYKINGIYEVKNLDLEEKYNSILEERKSTKAVTKIQGGKNCYKDTFYHGTSYSSLEKILGISGKFRTPTNEEVVTGSMLGLGVYLADKSSKSMQYCGEGYGRRGKRSGALLICEASLGASSSKNNKAIRINKNNGRDTVFAQAGDWGLLNNEWCVPNDDAVLPKYIIDIELL